MGGVTVNIGERPQALLTAIEDLIIRTYILLFRKSSLGYPSKTMLHKKFIQIIKCAAARIRLEVRYLCPDKPDAG